MPPYARYHIPAQPAPPRARQPSRFRVRVNRVRLAALLLKELVHYRARLPVVLSRPCVYGVFSGPLGGFAPRELKCVGCLRCTVEFPDVVRILPNPERLALGDSYFTAEQVETVLYEAATGRVPVRGAGYRGAFAGPGWDAMWTDMSEIVRPTRDGIHGREFISTAIDLGGRPSFLAFAEDGRPANPPQTTQLGVPIIFDHMPRSVESRALYDALADAAAAVHTLAIVPWAWARRLAGDRMEVMPLVNASEVESVSPSGRRRALELDGWDEAAFRALRARFPQAIVALRVGYEQPLEPLYRAGVRVIHLVADYHGQTPEGFVAQAIRARHAELVRLGIREEVTLLGSGGVVAAEHVPKAIMCGLDAVALDTALLIAVQARFHGPVRDGASAPIELPAIESGWARQRLINLVASWHDQLLEVLGAMGMREVRRLRGELGRAMFHEELEREAFAEIPGFEVAGG